MSIFLIISNESSSRVPLRNRNKLSKVFAHSVSFSLNLTTKSSIMNQQHFRGPAAKPRSHFSSVGRAVSIVAGKAARACYTTVSSQHSPSAALTYTHVQDTRARYKAECQLKKKKDHSSVLDVIVVASISSNTKETRKHVGEKRANEQEGSSLAHAARDDDTIWSFAPETCDNITTTWYVLGVEDTAQRLYASLATITERGSTPTRTAIHIRK